MNLWTRLRRIIGPATLLALAVLLAGCSTIKLGYNNLDEITFWWLDRYVDFDDGQESRVREDLGRLHRWHRVNELPHFTALLRDVEHAARGDISPAQACGFFTRVRERVKVLASQAEPAVATLALGLSPDQVRNIERKYQKNNSKFRKDWLGLSPTDVTDRRMDLLLERGEMVYGRLDDGQIAALRGLLQSAAFDPQRVLAERQRRQRDVLQTLRAVTVQGISLDEAKAKLHGLLDRMQEPPGSADRAYQQSVIDEGCRTFSALHNSMTPAQRDVAVRRLRAWQRDLQELAAQR